MKKKSIYDGNRTNHKWKDELYTHDITTMRKVRERWDKNRKALEDGGLGKPILTSFVSTKNK
jgi:hypothetical protein